MTFLEKLEVIERVDSLIRRKATGSPSTLASRLKVSERCVYDIIKIMKAMGAPIYYSNINNSYCYEYEVHLNVGFQDEKRITGGRSFYFATEDFLQYTDLSLFNVIEVRNHLVQKTSTLCNYLGSSNSKDISFV